MPSGRAATISHLTMRNSFVVLIGVGTLLASCETGPAPAREMETVVPNVLPLLWADPLPPIRNQHRFDSSHGSLEVGSLEVLDPPKEPPFPTDDEAVAFLRSWIEEHFGPLPQDTALAVERVHRSADGDDVPHDDGDRGHTVVFRQTWRGVLTDRCCVLYLHGRSHVSGSIDLGRFATVEGTERPLLSTVAADVAIGGVLSALGQGSVHPSKVRRTLQYIWQDERDGRDCLRLVWILGDGPFFIDAHSGQPGRNG